VAKPNQVHKQPLSLEGPHIMCGGCCVLGEPGALPAPPSNAAWASDVLQNQSQQHNLLGTCLNGDEEDDLGPLFGLLGDKLERIFD